MKFLPSYWKGCNQDIEYLFAKDIQGLLDEFYANFLSKYYGPLALQNYGYITFGQITINITKYTQRKKTFHAQLHKDVYDRVLIPIEHRADLMRCLYRDLSQAYAYIKNKDLPMDVYFLGSSEEGLPNHVKEAYQRYYIYKGTGVINR